MSKRKCHADPATQSKIRELIRSHEPVQNMVEILTKATWYRKAIVIDEDGKEREEIVDRTPEFTAKLRGWSQLLDKVVPNLRHSTKQITDERRRGLADRTDAELVAEIAERNGVDAGGEGTSRSH